MLTVQQDCSVFLGLTDKNRDIKIFGVIYMRINVGPSVSPHARGNPAKTPRLLEIDV